MHKLYHKMAADAMGNPIVALHVSNLDDVAIWPAVVTFSECMPGRHWTSRGGFSALRGSVLRMCKLEQNWRILKEGVWKKGCCWPGSPQVKRVVVWSV